MKSGSVLVKLSLANHSPLPDGLSKAWSFTSKQQAILHAFVLVHVYILVDGALISHDI